MKRACLLLLALPLAACSANGFPADPFGPLTAFFADGTQPTTRPLAAPLRPAGRPAPGDARGMAVASLVDGTTSSFAVRPYGNGVRVRHSDGCVSTRVLDWFSPADSWANCGTSRDWHTAQARVRELDSLYPLKLGSTGRYQRRAVSHSGATSTRETRCAVTGAVAVVRPGGAETPAFVVECDDSRVRRTTWYAPDLGPVAYREVHRRKGVREAWVRIE